MVFEDLSPREKSVLGAVIEHYVATAQPVGSKIIVHKYDLGISSATIRNTMQKLEDLGLIDQPHTSAGRIPTDKGYRVYVDYILKPEMLSAPERKKIKEKIMVDYKAIEELFEQTSKVLGDISKQLGVSLAPSFDKGILTNIDLIPVAEKKLLVILAVKSGLVKTILLEAESSLKSLALEKTKNILNERLCGLTLKQIVDSMDQRLKDTSSADPKLIRLFLNSKEVLVSFQKEENIHLGGTLNIVNQPEFQNQDKLSSLIELLEEKKTLAELFSRKGISEGITITIGKEHKHSDFSSLSLVTSAYQAKDLKGTIGIVGPKRMKYAKLVSLVDYTSKLLSEILSR
ncbi:MAG: hypothetical protein AMJ90_01465 [candidate division Zixibacteria bacterium SM23_73_2]|nr:MAG: hypothetical protein AMJ90_01465 [candidate division Zixibacteria bacterium SM23_73_2]